MVTMGNGKRGRWKRWLVISLSMIITAGFLLPEDLHIPVEGATSRDWNHDTFWYTPWGRSGVHKGIDIFATRGRQVRAATGGLLVYRGELGIGGRVVAVLGPKWRIHYYAHLKEFAGDAGLVIHQGEVLGSVGTSGNAAGKAPHLHYTILSLFPYPWRWDTGPQGWKKMFYLNPSRKLLDTGRMQSHPEGT